MTFAHQPYLSRAMNLFILFLHIGTFFFFFLHIKISRVTYLVAVHFLHRPKCNASSQKQLCAYLGYQDKRWRKMIERRSVQVL